MPNDDRPPMVPPPWPSSEAPPPQLPPPYRPPAERPGPPDSGHDPTTGFLPPGHRPDEARPAAPSYGPPQYAPPQYGQPGSSAPQFGSGQPSSPGVPQMPPGSALGSPGGRSSAKTVAWILVGLSGLLLVIVAVGAALWFSTRGPDHPDTWDPTVTELVSFIESERDVEFDHPVYVNYLSEEKYRSFAGEVGAGGDVSGEITDEEAEYAEQDLAVYRALGLIGGDIDLDAASSSFFADGTAAFYDPETDQIYVRGEPDASGQLSVDQQLVVLHELTHALQHQVVDPEVIYGTDDEYWSETVDVTDARLAVLEGDATLMEQAFAAELTDTEYDELIARSDEQQAEADTTLDEGDVPDVIGTMFGLPYQFGPSWVRAELYGPNARSLADSLEAGLPTTAEILGLRTDRVEAVEVDYPDLPDGAEEIYTDTWGAFSWIMPLVSYGDPSTAFAAVDAWEGDSVQVFYDSDERICLDAVVQLDGADGADAFLASGTTWAEGQPAESGATVERVDETVRVHSCDPGADVTIEPTADAVAALDALALTNDIASTVIAEGASVDSASCYADGLIEEFTVERLTDDAELVESAEFELAKASIMESCGI